LWQRFRIGGWKWLKSLRIAVREKACQIPIAFFGLESCGKSFAEEKGNTSGLGANTALTPEEMAVV